MAAPQHPFPAAPVHENVNVIDGYTRVKEIWDRGAQYLAQEEPDPLRLRITADELMDLDDLMEALVEEVDSEEWIKVPVPELGRIQAEANRIEAVAVVQTGRRGRPRKRIDEEILQTMLAN
ncbi:hypothetical protein SISNIDRAFT_471645 [Sistotremastrum niveocremeum HHB9708]|uniref:Uncharacterized protein n=1 Tax=Sistotremastrum niveocremeum HHB9708 TaxID=1314777 RepID=A0A164MDX1_9AGAM|nr:hypothetical protein SISNIDRAFT_471645 [Sistotremastrum niveocremeum HHB9708]